MARTAVNTVRMIPALTPVDAAEVAVAIDTANGMRVVPAVKTRGIVIRVTNTHASPHQVTVRAVPGAGNPRGAFGGPGPSGSSPTEPNFVSTAIPATTGVRFIVVPAHFVQTDGSIYLDFEAAHTGTVSAAEVP
jgi:hypothetical protein